MLSVGWYTVKKYVYIHQVKSTKKGCFAFEMEYFGILHYIKKHKAKEEKKRFYKFLERPCSFLYIEVYAR